MKLNILDEDDSIIQILNSCIASGDFNLLFDSLNDDENCRDKLDDVFSQIDLNIEVWNQNLSSAESLISNALLILTELIQLYGVICENLCIRLSRTILFLIVDEDCSIINIKRAINVLNLLIKTPSIITALVHDAKLEGTLQILGRMLPGIGDYECQALLYEALYRTTCNENREYWSNVWFSDKKARKFFLNLDPHKFESNCRAALNYINGNETERRVFSVIAINAFFGSFELIQPFGTEFWVDFNYGSESVSFYCSETSIDPLNDSVFWETILITKSAVKAYYIEENSALKANEVILYLNCPCHDLITSSNITNPAFNSFQIKLIFWSLLVDIQKHLERIYGREKCKKNPLPENAKSLETSSPVKILVAENEAITANMLLNEIRSKRKTSGSSPIPIETKNVMHIPEKVPVIARISDSYEAIEIEPEEEHAVIDHEIHPVPKSYNSQVIPVSPEEEHAVIDYETHPVPKSYNSQVIPVSPEAEAYQNANMFAKRKASSSSSNIKITDGSDKSYAENGHDENYFEPRAIKNNKKQKKELNTYEAEKITTLPVSPASLENINAGALTNDITTKTGIEAENDSKHSTNKSVEKSPTSFEAHYSNINFEDLSKNTISKENVNSYSTSIFARKEFTVYENKAEEQDDKISENSDVFADVSVIDDSLVTKPKSVGNVERYQKSNSPSSEIVELPIASKERKLKRKLSMVSDIDNENAAPNKNLSESSEGAHDSKIAAEKQPKKIFHSHEQFDKSCENASNFETVPEKQSKRLRLSHEDLSESSKRASDSETFAVKQPRKVSLSREKFGESSKRTSDSETIPKEQQKKIRLSHEEFDEPSKEVRDPENFLEKQLTNDHLLHEELGVSSEKISNSEVIDQEQAKRIHPLHEGSDNSSGEVRNSETVPTNQARKKLLSQKELSEPSQGTSKSETVPKKQQKKIRLYNLDTEPVYDVPPTKVSNKTATSRKEQMEHYVCDLDEQHDSGDSREPISDKGNSNSNLNSCKRISKAEKMDVYNLTHFISDEEREASDISDLSSKRKKYKKLSSFGARSSRKKKIETPQTGETKKSPRPTRRAAVNAMKVNKRILDQTSEVACDEIQVLDEAEKSKSPTVKRRKYSKVFSTYRNTDTETVSSEVSWLKQQKKCPLFQSPKRDFSSWKKNQLRKKSLPEKVVSNRKKPYQRKIIDTGSKLQHSTWSDFESFNLAIEKRKPNSRSVLNAFENELQNLSPTTHNSNVNNETDYLPANQTVHESCLNNNAESNNSSRENNLLEECNEPDIVHDNPYDNIEDNSRARFNYKDKINKSNYHEVALEEKIKRKYASSNNTATDEHVYTQKNDSRVRHNYKYNTEKSEFCKAMHAVNKNKKRKNASTSFDKCDEIQDNTYKKRPNYKGKNDKYKNVEDIHEMRRNVEYDSNSCIASDEKSLSKNLVNSTSPLPPLAEFNNTLQEQNGSQSDPSGFAIDQNIPPTPREMDFQNEVQGKQLLLQQFLECAVKCSESSIDNWKSSSLPNIHIHSKDKNHKTANKKDRRAKTSESSESLIRQKYDQLQSPAKDFETESLESLGNCSLEDLGLRNSVDTMYPENNSSVENLKFVNKMKRKKISLDSKEKNFERPPYKKSKLYDTISDLLNCTLDPLSLRHSSESVRATHKISRNMDNRASDVKKARRNFDSGFEEMHRSGNTTKKTKLKSSNIFEKSLDSKLSTISFKEVESNMKWFRKITYALSQDTDVLTKRLLGTVQKCYCEYSAKMSFLRERIHKVVEMFHVSAAQNIKASKLKNLIRTCGVVRSEVEKSLKAIKITGAEYFEAEEKNYRKLRHKHNKASKKYLLSMQNAKKDAVHKLEGNVLLKTKYFFRKFMKHMDSA